MRYIPFIYLLLAPTILQAQEVVHPFSKGDSYIYHEKTDSQQNLTTPMEEIVSSSIHDATILFKFDTSNSASAKYNKLILQDKSPLGDTSADTSPIIGEEFLLNIDQSGKVETIEHPEFTEEIKSLTDLSIQFDDFFLSLPKSVLDGLTSWSDSSSTIEEGLERKKHIRFTIVGDTLLAEGPAYVVETIADITINVTLEDNPAPGYSLYSKMLGQEIGRVYFAKDNGLMLLRNRSAEFKGEVKIEGGPQPMTFPQSRSYVSSIALMHERLED